MTDLSRRRMLTGAAVAAAATAATAVGPPLQAEAAIPPTPDNIAAFVNLSVGLTGVDSSRLAPGVDPINIRQQYFVQAAHDPNFDALMAIALANKTDPNAAASQVMNSTNAGVKYLGRAILLAWYTGCWYAPDSLRLYNSPQAPKLFLDPQKVVSGAAYTQGWNWAVAQTHPMGYSVWQFGYWHANPPPLDAFIKKQQS